MAFKLLLIDIDDTICNSSEAYEAALSKCYLFLKKKFPLLEKEHFFEAYKKAKNEIHIELNGTASMHNRFLYFQRLFELFGLTLDPDVLDDVTELYWNETYRNIRLYSGVKKSLEILKANNLKIGIVSDLVAHIQIKKLRKLRIADYIDFIVTSEEAGKEKPHPSIFLLALQKASCLPHEAVMVGDSFEKDIAGAKHIGMCSVLVSQKHEPDADYTIKNFRELTGIFGIKPMKKSQKRYVIFDLIGTLFYEGHVIKNRLYPLMLKHNNKSDYSAIKKLYVDYSLGKISQKEFWNYVPQDIEKKFLSMFRPDKSMMATAHWLKQKGYALGILSNMPKEWGEYLIKKFKLNKIFSLIILSGEYGTRKPDEMLYTIFLERSKAKAGNCYLIDDSLGNLKEARFLLMKTIWCAKEKQDAWFIPDYKIIRASDLKGIL